MVHEGWYMVQEAKLWYDYIIMVRSGNAATMIDGSDTPQQRDTTFNFTICVL